MKGWKLAVQCHDAGMAPLLQSGLEAQGIPSVLLNKQDSSYVGMCFATRPVEICVPEGKMEEAKAWLEAPER